VTPETLARLRANGPDIRERLERAGLHGLIVDDRDGIRVQAPFHKTPEVLHDVDDVRWLALDIAHEGRAA
jgi:hypothetical protein